jgi:hypothetical protein
MYTQNKLSPLKHRTNKNIKIMGFDIETEGEKNNFVLGCFWSRDIKMVCKSVQEVKDFINSPKIKKYKIYATNLAFDFLGVFYNESKNWQMIERGGRVYSFKYLQQNNCKKKSFVSFFDTLNVFPASVKKLGDLINIPKMEHPSCFAKIPQNVQEERELIEYCMNDSKISCEFINQILLPFSDKYGIKMKLTIGSLALTDFRTNHLKFDIHLESEESRQLAFKSYYGGRTETYKRGSYSNVYCFDINSLYPSVMLKEYPNPNKNHYYDKGDMYGINTYEGLSKVVVFVPDMYLPPLPYRKDGKLLFPTGKFTGYYNHNELRNAMKYGVKILEIGEQLVYPETYPFFTDYIKKHYDERLKLQKEDSPIQYMEKLMMNSLYGKFAFRYDKATTLVTAKEFDYKKHVENVLKVEPLFDGKFYNITYATSEPAPYSFPILSSYIASEARIKMYEYLSNPQLSTKIISTDTDSIFLTDYEGEIKTSDKLGDMKLEKGYPVKDGIFIRPKMYKTVKFKCKGVQVPHNPIEANEVLQKILNKETIHEQRFVKFKGALRSKIHHKNGILKPNEIINVHKTLDLEDSKRVWSKEFNEFEQQDSSPIKIKEDIDIEALERIRI